MKFNIENLETGSLRLLYVEFALVLFDTKRSHNRELVD
jgi:hypothetical protein